MSLINRLNAVIPHIHRNAIKDENLNTIQYLAYCLPNIGMGMFELEPGNPNKTDFGIVIENPQHLEGLASFEIPSYWRENVQEAWEAIQRLAANMLTPSLPVASMLHTITIAYDIPNLMPWIYYTLSPSVRLPNIRLLYINQLLQRIGQSQAHDQNREVLTQLLDKIPENITTLHFAHIPVRDGHQLRLVFAPFPDWKELVVLLEQVPSLIKLIDRGKLKAWFKYADFCQVSIDLSDNQIVPKLGLEFWLPPNQPDTLIAQFLQSFQQERETYNSVFSYVDVGAEPKRWLNHTKITITPQGESFKYYFSFR